MDKGESPNRTSSSDRSYPVRDVNLVNALNLFPGRILNARVESFLSQPEDAADSLILNIQTYRVVAETELQLDRGQPLLVEVQSLEHPIEVSIIDPERVPDDLTEQHFKNLLKGTEFDDREVPLELLEAVLEDRGQLDAEDLELALRHQDFLMEDPSSRMKSLRILDDTGLPLTEDRLEKLGSLPGNSTETEAPWNQLTGSDSPDSIAGLIRGLGIDYVRQLTERPEEAGETLHPRMLAESRQQRNPSAEQLASQLLALGLINASSEETSLVLPIPIQGRVRHIKLRSRPDPMAAGAYRMDLQVPTSPNSSQDLRADLAVRPGEVVGEWVLPDSATDSVHRELERLARGLEQRGFSVDWTSRTGSPKPLDPFEAAGDTDSFRPRLDVHR